MQNNNPDDAKKIIFNEGSVCAANTRQQMIGLFNKQLVTIPGQHRLATNYRRNKSNEVLAHVKTCRDCGLSFEVVIR